MSQGGIVDVEGANPQIPTNFVTDSGTAIPIANTIEILATTTDASGTPIETTASGNTITIDVQIASAADSSSLDNAGLASFDTNAFNVDENGFVTFTGGGGTSDEGVSLFVVDSQGNAGYTTIQAAIDAAALVATSTTPQTVWIWPGTYDEGGTLTLAPFVNLASAAGSVYITASCTLTSSGTADQFLCTSIAFNTTTGTAFTVDQTNSSGICTIVFDLCTFNPLAGGCISATSANTNQSTLYQNNCISNSLSGYNIYESNGYNITLTSCNNFNSGFVNSIINNDAQLTITACIFADSFDITNSCFGLIQGCNISPLGSGAAFNLDDTSGMFIADCTFISVNGNYISGTGSVTYSDLNFINCSNPTLEASSINPGSLHTGSVSFDQGISNLNTNSQCPNYEVVLGTGTSALTAVSGTGTSGQLLTSNGASAAPTWQDSSAISSIYVDLSGPVSGSTISLFALSGDGSAVGGSTLAFSASSSTEIDLQTTDSNLNTMIGENAGTPSLSTNGIQNTAFGYGALGSGSSATLNTAVGYEALNESQSDQGNTAVGWGTLTFLNGGNANTAVGFQALNSSTEDGSNTSVGSNSLLVVNGGSYNSALGFEAGFGVVNGSFNTYLGFGSGSAHASDESSNLIIGSNGVAGDQNVIRIGNQGTDPGEQTSCYIAGIYNNDSSGFTSPLPVYVDSSTGQLGYGASSFNSINVQTFTSSGTYTPTTGMAYCWVRAVAGGGGGGGAAATSSSVAAGAGGSAGSYVEGFYDASTIGASQSVTIGSAGSGATAGNNSGGTGGDTLFGSLITAKGGNGGGGSGSLILCTQEGAIGDSSSSGGYLRTTGQGGGNSFGIFLLATGVCVSGGFGGSSVLGGGGTAQSAEAVSGTFSTSGNVGAGYGAGGAGGISGSVSGSAASAAGGNGSAGIIIVTEYIV